MPGAFISISRKITTGLVLSLLLLIPVQSGANELAVSSPAHIISGFMTESEGRIALKSIIDTFGLRSSMDLLGDRLDLVGDKGSCRLLLDSPLVLSGGVFSVLSGPLAFSDNVLTVPVDFLEKALPALTARSVEIDAESSVVTVGDTGTGSFSGAAAGQLDRQASFIRRNDILSDRAVAAAPTGLSVVVIDPGHGGRSEGAKGSTGTMEKELVLAISRKLKRLLEEELGIKVVLTRSADYFVGLKERTAIANNNRAELLLSIHANATFRKEIDGFETYYLSFKATDKAASSYAKAENKELGVEGGKEDKALLEAILWDMAQMDYLRASGQFANMVQGSLVKRLGWKDRGVRQAPFAVLMGARMPAALVEIGFISNPEQEIKLNRASHQDRIARALYDAVADYHRSLLRGEIGRE
jgi:N-acetylmuramoyl-L-alanine amidase